MRPLQRLQRPLPAEAVVGAEAVALRLKDAVKRLVVQAAVELHPKGAEEAVAEVARRQSQRRSWVMAFI